MLTGQILCKKYIKQVSHTQWFCQQAANLLPTRAQSCYEVNKVTAGCKWPILPILLRGIWGGGLLLIFRLNAASLSLEIPQCQTCSLPSKPQNITTLDRFHILMLRHWGTCVNNLPALLPESMMPQTSSQVQHPNHYTTQAQLGLLPSSHSCLRTFEERRAPPCVSGNELALW